MAMNIMEAITPEMGCSAVQRVRHFSKKALKNNGAPNKKSGNRSCRPTRRNVSPATRPPAPRRRGGPGTAIEPGQLPLPLTSRDEPVAKTYDGGKRWERRRVRSQM